MYRRILSLGSVVKRRANTVVLAPVGRHVARTFVREHQIQRVWFWPSEQRHLLDRIESIRHCQAILWLAVLRRNQTSRLVSLRVQGRARTAEHNVADRRLRVVYDPFSAMLAPS
jgi:hypothetical protein